MFSFNDMPVEEIEKKIRFSSNLINDYTKTIRNKEFEIEKETIFLDYLKKILESRKNN